MANEIGTIKNNKPTRKDVAELAGVSEQTVSYIFNDKRKFSVDIVKRVNAAITELNYKPDMIARSMVKGNTQTICAIIEDIRNPVYAEIINGIEQEASKNMYFVNLIDARGSTTDILSNILARRVDGIYLSLINDEKMSEFVLDVVRAGVKVVLGNDIPLLNNSKKIPFVAANLDAGMRKIVRYLATMGHKNIAYINGLDKNSPYDSRAKAYTKECLNIYSCEQVMINKKPPYSTSVISGYELASEWYNNHKNCTAVITTNDLMAIGFLKRIRELNLNVPDDVSIVGIDNISFSDATFPPLTTIGFNRELYGKEIFLTLLNEIEGNNTYDLFIDCDLIIRNSVKKI